MRKTEQSHWYHLFAYITHSAIQSLSDITGGSMSNYIQLPMEPQKALYYLLPFLMELLHCANYRNIQAVRGKKENSAMDYKRSKYVLMENNMLNV